MAQTGGGKRAPICMEYGNYARPTAPGAFAKKIPPEGGNSFYQKLRKTY
jgi:hypothetical protein